MLFCHFVNSLIQLRMVFSGQTTSAVLNFRFFDSSTVWRNATTCKNKQKKKKTYENTMNMKAQ